MIISLAPSSSMKLLHWERGTTLLLTATAIPSPLIAIFSRNADNVIGASKVYDFEFKVTSIII